MPPTRDNLDNTIAEVSALLDSDASVSPALRALIKLLIGFINALSASLSLDSSNSSKPPSSDPNRKKSTGSKKKKRKPGGQPGHSGSTLTLTDSPDEICPIKIDRRSLPNGRIYSELEPQRRQVVDVIIKKIVTEFQAQVLKDDLGNIFVAPFPDDVPSSVQYGPNIKTHAIYLSQFQLLPYDRIKDYLNDQFDIPISAGTLVNFNKQLFGKLEAWQAQIPECLLVSPVLHADETGINIGGKKVWLHVCSNPHFTLLSPHLSRGGKAMIDIGILDTYTGVLCHDHLKAYYSTATLADHSLCGAHHERELTWSFEQDNQAWAEAMYQFLNDLNKEVHQVNGVLSNERQNEVRLGYRKILERGDIECPPPDERTRKPGQRGRLARSKSRNLLERLRAFEEDTLRFMTRWDIPYTNNQAENDLRMFKVQQKISGCFRSFSGAEIFCRNRSYISTCRKQGLSATDAIRMALVGQIPTLTIEQSAE